MLLQRGYISYWGSLESVASRYLGIVNNANAVYSYIGICRKEQDEHGTHINTQLWRITNIKNEYSDGNKMNITWKVVVMLKVKEHELLFSIIEADADEERISLGSSKN